MAQLVDELRMFVVTERDVHVTIVASGTSYKPGAKIVFEGGAQELYETDLREMLEACQKARQAYRAADTKVPPIYD